MKRVVKAVAALIVLSWIITWVVFGRPTIFGIRPFFVMTDSMEPTIRARSFILAAPVWPEDVQEGDIIVYRRSMSRFLTFSVVHRVIRIEDDGNIFIFRGDHEKEEDTPVSADQIRYRVIYP